MQNEHNEGKRVTEAQKTLLITFWGELIVFKITEQKENLSCN